MTNTVLLSAKVQEDIKETSINYIQRLELASQLDESSGLMYWNGKLWSHNDSGGTDSIYAFEINNPKNIEQYYTGAPNKDWEALEQDDKYLYIGDFGNNKVIQRKDLRIFRIEKQSLLDHSPIVDTIYFNYPDQKDLSDRTKTEDTDFDCEAFIVTDNNIYLFTKQWISKNTALYSLPKEPGNYIANYIATYNINGLVTDAAYLKSKRILALCGYSSTFLRQFIYIFYDFDGENFFDGKKQNFSLNLGLFPHQTEGIATTDGKIYYVTNEYQSVSPQRLHTFDVSDYFREYLLRPETAGKIEGPQTVCQDNLPQVYSVSPIYQAKSYEWTLPQGATGTSIENSILVRFDTSAVSGKITVRGINKYGTGGRSELAVNVNKKPATPVISVLKESQHILVSSAKWGNQWYNQEGVIAGATRQTYEVTTYGDYYVIVTQNGCSSDLSNRIQTGCLIYQECIPVLDIDEVLPTDSATILYKQAKKETKKRKKFLFWYF